MRAVIASHRGSAKVDPGWLAVTIAAFVVGVIAYLFLNSGGSGGESVERRTKYAANH